MLHHALEKTLFTAFVVEIAQRDARNNNGSQSKAQSGNALPGPAAIVVQKPAGAAKQRQNQHNDQYAYKKAQNPVHPLSREAVTAIKHAAAGIQLYPVSV